MSPSLNSAPIRPALARYLIPPPPASPTLSTSAVATPSGKRSGFSTMSARRSGMVNSTPIRPPSPAISVISQ